MIRFTIVSITSGLFFGVMDGLINANPLAVKLNEYYSPILRTSINAPAGIAIDLLYGFVLAGFFILFYKSLPGKSGLTKGIVYGLFDWFLRVAMMSASQWMMFNVPPATLVYGLIAGLIEMLLLGIFYGLTLKPQLKFYYLDLLQFPSIVSIIWSFLRELTSKSLEIELLR